MKFHRDSARCKINCYKVFPLSLTIKKCHFKPFLNSFICFSVLPADLVSSSNRQYWTMISWKIWIWIKSVRLSIACTRFSMRPKVSLSKRAMSEASFMSWKVSSNKLFIFFVIISTNRKMHLIFDYSVHLSLSSRVSFMN